MRQLLLSGAVSMVVALFGTRWAIAFLSRRGFGQLIRDDGPTTHHSKRGTPTMGGAVIIAAVLAGYVAAHLLSLRGPTASGVLLLFLMIGLGSVGFTDDYLKIRNQRSLGLRSAAKLMGQAFVAIIFAVAALQFEDANGLTPASSALSITRDTALVLGPLLFLVWAYLMIAATSNAVNLTDGLDGLATGAAAITFSAYALIGVWQFGQSCERSTGTGCYEVRDPLDLALIAAALAGACVGFLWWNTSPAQIFMGDTGSLALGGAMAGLAILTRTELLLLLMGGLFVVVTASVILQVASFRLTGRRIFRMAPLQHHFELRGWAEVTIVVRFWIVGFLGVAGALGIFYAEWVSGAIE